MRGNPATFTIACARRQPILLSSAAYVLLFFNVVLSPTTGLVFAFLAAWGLDGMASAVFKGGCAGGRGRAGGRSSPVQAAQQAGWPATALASPQPLALCVCCSVTVLDAAGIPGT